MNTREIRSIAREIARNEQASDFWETAGDAELKGYYGGSAEALVQVLYRSDAPMERVRNELALARMQQSLELVQRMGSWPA